MNTLTPLEATSRYSAATSRNYRLIGSLVGGETGATAIEDVDGERRVLKWEGDPDRRAGRWSWCRVTGSHQGHGIGVAPTNQPVEFTGMVMVRVRDGKIVEAWNEFNFMEMYKQVGALTLNLQ
jgi:hypothetical protein